MYLKSLEVQGFKSFPDKTLIRFGDDITAIVGPNGSGKSNISDAILWVMGEQSSKTLRGAKMEDVIFGGTQKRAAVGFAEATLTLDNTDRALAYDADEVMVTRRFYRSGDDHQPQLVTGLCKIHLHGLVDHIQNIAGCQHSDAKNHIRIAGSGIFFVSVK